MYGQHGHDFNSVVVLQNCMGFIRDERDSGSEECVTTLADGTEDGILKVEEAYIKIEESVNIKEKNPETLTFPAIKTEPEVSEWSLCLRQQQFLLPRPFAATKL
jgi:hypothetical protein